jgi:hypothetical protein
MHRLLSFIYIYISPQLHFSFQRAVNLSNLALLRVSVYVQANRKIPGELNIKARSACVLVLLITTENIRKHKSLPYNQVTYNLGGKMRPCLDQMENYA